MIKAGKYVFAIQQDKGTNIIDTETDQLIKCIENVNIQGITQSFDGNVWLASSTTLDCLNPETLEIEETLNLPQGAEITWVHGDRPHSVQVVQKTISTGMVEVT